MRIAPISINNTFHLPAKTRADFSQVDDFNGKFLQKYSDAIKAQVLSNVSFGARPAPPVYKIDENLNCTLYSKQSDLAKDMGVSAQCINGCLSGKRNSVMGYVIAYNHQVEKKLEDGTTVIDKKKVAELYNKRTQPKAVYTCDYLGNIKKYDSHNQIDSTRGLFIIPACDVESFDDEGQMHLDRRKISLNVLNNPNYLAVYSRDENGILTKYENQSAFAKEQGISTVSVSAAVLGRLKTVCGFNLIPAVKIETVSESGEIIVDKQKVIDYLSENIRDEKVVYTVSPKLEYKRYASKKELAEKNGMNYSSMIKTSRTVTPNGDYIIEAGKIEDYDDSLQLVVNKSKLAKLVAERISNEKICVIDINMNIEEYENLESVAVALERKVPTIRTTLWNPDIHKSVADRVVVRASEIEIIDENGNVSIDRKKVAKLVRDRLCKSAVYLVDDKGQCKKYKNRFSAASAYGCSPSASQNVRINGYVLVDASLIEEIEEDGSITLNQEKIAEYAKISNASF